ncbi:MAG: hypothetical protein J7501_17005, partial [Bdellovibrio sp.]|nr:hypothetical protein [Bdellovibrio sp.]
FDVLGKRANLSDVAGEGRNKDLKTNSIYDLALEASGGSPSRALEVIAICGNDDRQPSFELPLNKTDKLDNLR